MAASFSAFSLDRVVDDDGDAGLELRQYLPMACSWFLLSLSRPSLSQALSSSRLSPGEKGRKGSLATSAGDDPTIDVAADNGSSIGIGDE